MRIALFHNLPYGGAKRALYNFARSLNKAGCLIDVFVPATGEEDFLQLSTFAHRFEAVPIHRTAAGIMLSTLHYILPIKGYSVSLADLETTHERIAAMINGGRYDVVFVEQDQFTISPFILKSLDKPHIYYCPQPARVDEAVLKKLLEFHVDQENATHFPRRIWRAYLNARISAIDKRNASFAKYILTNSYYSREAILKSYGLNSYVCYLGIDNELFHPMHLKRKDFILSVGSMTSAKGYDFLVRSLSKIKTQARPRLIIVANIVDERWMRYVEHLAIDRDVRIEIRTLIKDSELIELYNEAKLLVYAPYLEPFGLVPLEAMACSTPVVAVREGGIRETVINNVTGILIDRDENQFAQAIAALISDEKRREEIGNQALAVINGSWTMQHSVANLLKHLEKAISAWPVTYT